MHAEFSGHIILPFLHHLLSHPLLEIDQKKSQRVRDNFLLDAHAIDQLREIGVPPTNDLFKYNYVADDKGCYGEYDGVKGCSFVPAEKAPCIFRS